MGSVSVNTLSNGVRLVVQQLPHVHTMGLSVLIGVGSADESLAEAGLTHLLEHMLFRGSKLHRDSRRLLLPFELAGGTLEAETWRDHTHFCCELEPTAAAPALAALGSMLTAPTLTGLERERRLVAAEIGEELDDEGDDTSLHQLTRRLVWPDHAFSRPITGTLAQLKLRTKDQLRAHHGRHYVGERVVVAIAGPRPSVVLAPLVEHAFGRLSRGTPARAPHPPSFAPISGLTIVPAESPQLSLQLSFDALPSEDPHFAALEQSVALLQEGMLSRLHVALSERSGLVYRFEAGLDAYRGAATCDIEVCVEPRRLLSALAALCAALTALATDGPSEEELACLVARQRAEEARLQDRPAEAAYQAGLAHLFQERGLPGHKTGPAAVDASLIREVAQRVFLRARRHLLVVGSVGRGTEQRLRRAWATLLPAPEPGLHATSRSAGTSRERARLPVAAQPSSPANHQGLVQAIPSA